MCVTNFFFWTQNCQTAELRWFRLWTSCFLTKKHKAQSAEWIKENANSISVFYFARNRIFSKMSSFLWTLHQPLPVFALKDSLWMKIYVPKSFHFFSSFLQNSPACFDSCLCSCLPGVKTWSHRHFDLIAHVSESIQVKGLSLQN